MKLVRNPAPPAANPCSGMLKSSAAGRGLAQRTRVWSWLYATKRPAVSAIDPNMGTGRP
jgi:hypothetical protein